MDFAGLPAKDIPGPLRLESLTFNEISVVLWNSRTATPLRLLAPKRPFGILAGPILSGQDEQMSASQCPRTLDRIQRVHIDRQTGYESAGMAEGPQRPCSQGGREDPA